MLQPSYQITAAASNKSECYQTTPGCVGGWPCNVEGRVGGFMGIWIRGYGWTGLGTVTCNYAQTLFRFVRSGKWRVNIIFEKNWTMQGSYGTNVKVEVDLHCLHVFPSPSVHLCQLLFLSIQVPICPSKAREHLSIHRFCSKLPDECQISINSHKFPMD